MQELMERQLSLFSEAQTHESLLYHGEELPGFFMLCQKIEGQPMRQDSYRNRDLPTVMEMLLHGGGYLNGDCYISQSSFANRTRRAVHLLSLSGAFVDLDFYRGDAPPLAQRLASMKPEDRVSLVLDYCDAREVPLPSLVIHSGRGMYLKWLHASALPKMALPRWNALQKHLVEKCKDLGADEAAKDASRILRVCGTHNHKAEAGNELVRVVWQQVGAERGVRTYDFHELCEWVLPYTQEEVRAFQGKLALWDASRKAQQEMHRTIKRAQLPAAEQWASQLWWDRLADIERLIQMRFGSEGIPEGQRNDFGWVIANCIAWNVPAASLHHEVTAHLRKFAPSLTQQEINQTASSVIRRVREGEGGYKMANATFRKHFGITGEEERQLQTLGSGRARRKPINEGAMGFEKMANLPHEEYLAETTRRRQEAGKYAAGVRLRASEDKRATARLMAASGKSSRQIAAELEVGYATIKRWIK